jgi:hypothetical protein
MLLLTILILLPVRLYVISELLHVGQVGRTGQSTVGQSILEYWRAVTFRSCWSGVCRLALALLE